MTSSANSRSADSRSASTRMLRGRTALAATAAAATLPLLLTTPAHADAGGPVGSTDYCSSATQPALAARLSGDIAQALNGRQSTLAFSVQDTTTGVSCTLNPSLHFDSASIVKVTILGAVLRRTQDENRSLTSAEEDDLDKMITESDNDAASDLWDGLGTTRLQNFLKLSGMDDTQLDPSWGLTQVTAADEMRQLDVFSGDSDVLTAANKAYGLNLMRQVESDQRWGTPFGAPSAVTVAVKNGWLQRATHGWRVHSLGIFTGDNELYQMAVLTTDDPTENYGIDTIQAVAQQVHQDLNALSGH
jgi:Beta-lactamase enzyme family